MSGIKALYHKYIYGLMGTLIFHILLFTSFLIAEIDYNGKVVEQTIEIDFRVLEEMQKKMDKVAMLNKQNSSSTLSEQRSMVGNRGVNDAKIKDNFFDKEYLNDVQNAQKLVKSVNSQLSKKIAATEDFDMPSVSTEGQEPESIKNIVYSGKSNIHYFLEKRYHIRLPIPVYLAKGGGIITVDILVDQQGRVIKAEPRTSSSINDPMLPEYAQNAASRTVFNADKTAPKFQSGTITYTFVPQ